MPMRASALTPIIPSPAPPIAAKFTLTFNPLPSDVNPDAVQLVSCVHIKLRCTRGYDRG